MTHEQEDDMRTLDRGPRSLSYAASRRLLLLGGSAILVVLAAVMYVRGVDPREVLATSLFVPVFLVALFYGMWGGIAAGTGAAILYVGLRWGAIDVVGFGAVAGTIMSRSAAYVVFGGISGWAITQFEAPISKLERFDYIDDVTGLYNARFFLENTELESSRAKRYASTFSVVVIEIPEGTLAPMSARQRALVLRRLGDMMVARSRSVDRVVHAADRSRHLFAIVLPETGAEGAGVLAQDLRQRIGRELRTAQGTNADVGGLKLRVVTPDAGGSLEALRTEFFALDRLKHPTPVSG